MGMGTARSKYILIATAAAAAGVAGAFAQRASAQVDTVQVVVGNANAVNAGTSLATFGYDPLHDQMFVISNFNANQSIRLISNVGGAQSVQTQVTESAWLLFEKAGNPNNGGGGPIPGGFLLNPKPIAALGLGSYSTGVFTDASTVVTTSPGVNAPDLTQRIYRYNLQQDANSDASDEMNSLMTLAQYQNAAGQTTNTTNMGRQFAWSGDGQSIYFVDTSSAYGGIWKQPVAGGAPTRLLNTSDDINTEPAVMSSGGVDTIFVRGGGTTGNLGGIDKITYDGVTATAREVAVSADKINDFLELPAGSSSITSFSMAADDSGNLYFNDTSSSTGRAGIYGLDAQGRLFKVISKAERQAVVGGSPGSNTLRMQPRTVSYSNGTANFDVTQVLYAESTPINLVAGAYVFKPGDFNRDNVLDSADIELFKNHLTVKSGPTLAIADARYDMNGNGICSFKDVKTLQQFAGFYDGDANIDGTVDTLDFNALAANFGGTAKIWTQADFNGDETVDTLDFNSLAANFGRTSSIGSARGVGALVPEPGSAGLVLAALGACGLRRRTRSRVG